MLNIYQFVLVTQQRKATERQIVQMLFSQSECSPSNVDFHTSKPNVDTDNLFHYQGSDRKPLPASYAIVCTESLDCLVIRTA